MNWVHFCFWFLPYKHLHQLWVTTFLTCHVHAGIPKATRVQLNRGKEWCLNFWSYLGWVCTLFRGTDASVSVVSQACKLAFAVVRAIKLRVWPHRWVKQKWCFGFFCYLLNGCWAVKWSHQHRFAPGWLPCLKTLISRMRFIICTLNTWSGSQPYVVRGFSFDYSRC